MIDRTTLLMTLSAFVLAVLCILPATRGMFPFWVIAAGGHIGDTLFHEMGHTTFFWLFGQPAIPMIFTLFGADQAGGMSMPFMNHSYVIEIGVLALMCWAAKTRGFLIPALVLAAVILLLTVLGYQDVVVGYMGHGGAIASGGFFLFRFWIYLDARNACERWLNAFFGFFLIASNFSFAYGLVFNAAANSDYSDHVAFGISHNDFMMLSQIIYSWSVRGIAIFTMVYCVLTVIASAIAARYLAEGFMVLE